MKSVDSKSGGPHGRAPLMSPNRAMKARHNFRRRFSLQPSFFKEDVEEDEPTSHRSTKRGESDTEATSGAGTRHKVVVMGAAKVGKSSIISRFLYGTFSDKYKRTVEEMHHGEFSVAGVRLTLDILDTSGAYEFPAMRALSISSADAFILVYDVNDAETFDEARVLRDQILETKAGTPAPIVVVGNKIDLAEEHREVERETTESVVTVDWENGFVEASAKDNVNITEVFKELLAQAKVKYNLSPALRRRRKQSLARHSISVDQGQQEAAAAAAAATAAAAAAAAAAAGAAGSHFPSPQQLQQLQQIRERQGKRNSCSIS
ncbi:GTP-binding protein Rhes-like isoform X1 [Schistocerca gregaria]|uniref:GTP-binding protein Rhes-like isoform X1 n=2 Tax=Schistocerca gregaria TaxID=7010 RepID=UPI00211E6A74|nr:GTP-binding protein Rhes-like isoform X1 [Schistocerca gregaria]